MTSTRIYIIDTSAFVVLDTLFPFAQWQPIWDFLGVKVTEGVLKTIDEVEEELKRKFYDLPITDWVKMRRSEINYPYIPEHFQYLRQEVYPRCNGLINPNSTSTLYADPMLLAIAGHDNHTLVTDEVLKEIHANTNPLKIKLPNHCSTLGVNCIWGRYAWTQLLNELGLQITGFKT
ncbi:MAG: DUF4411 family protein [Candidatus Paceibacterota bacterium]